MCTLYKDFPDFDKWARYWGAWKKDKLEKTAWKSSHSPSWKGLSVDIFVGIWQLLISLAITKSGTGYENTQNICKFSMLIREKWSKWKSWLAFQRRWRHNRIPALAYGNNWMNNFSFVALQRHRMLSLQYVHIIISIEVPSYFA